MMNKLFKLGVISIAIATLGACSRIETGEAGIRVNFSKEVEPTELLPGSWNQTLIGQVLTFPIKDVAVNLENKTPLTADNSALADFDITAIYSINPTSVAELYSTKSKAFHKQDDGKDKDIFLMYNFMLTVLNNASYKVVRNYPSLSIADNREKIEREIKDIVIESLKAEKLDTSITISMIQVRNVQPNTAILQAATDLVKSQNELKIKENEVSVARKEAERQKLLSENGPQTIAYMNATANLKIAEAIANGKVSAIVIPNNLTMLGGVSK